MTLPEDRRLVTVLFVDMVGFTSRTERSDPEEVREFQRAYFETVAAEIDRYAGTAEKYIGDAVMAIFGAPRAHGDDPERALRAALAIRSEVGKTPLQLEVRIGVATGEVVGGGAPGAHARDYTVTGDAVNVAARLEQTAEPGEIVVGAGTRHLTAAAFDFAPLPPLELHGKAAPVEAWRLVGVRSDRPRLRGPETPLVGRRRELALLDAALEEAAEGRRMMIGVSGEAGIGKSRLALEVQGQALAAGFDSVWAAAHSYASSFPYHVIESLVSGLVDGTPLVDVLGPTGIDVSASTLARWSAVLADIAGRAGADEQALLVELTPEARKRQLVQALSAVVLARAAERPQLFVLDDLHWADTSSVEVLDELFSMVAEQPVAVLALYRPGWANPWASRSPYQQVNLDVLRERDALRLVAALGSGSPTDDDRTRELLHRSGGNPFFLEELVRDGARSDGRGPLPETVQELLQARIDALSPDARTTLQTAAVVGTEFSARMLAEIDPVDDLDGALAALVSDDLVVPRGGDADDRLFAMRHPLVHEVAYRSLLVARRKVMHRRIGEWLEAHGGEEALAAIASHYREGDDLERARRFLPLAAARAMRINAPREARDAYLAAADLFDDPAGRASMLQPAAHLSYLVGDIAQAVETSHEVVRLFGEAGDRVRELDARRLRSRYYWVDGQGRRAEEEVVAAIEGLEQLPPSAELALAYSYHAQVRMLMPDYPTAISEARRAIEVADRVGSIDAKVHALNNLGTALIGTGDETGIADLRESLRLALEHRFPDDVGRAYINLANQGSAGISLVPADEAEALFDEMLAYDERVSPGGVFHQWHREGQAEFWFGQGRWAEVEAALRPLVDTVDANRYLRVNAGSYLALVLCFRGRYREAMDLTDGLREVAVGINDLQAYGAMLAASAHAARGCGDPDSAVDHLERGLDLRGTTVEHTISTYYLFEGTDVLSWLHRSGDAVRPTKRGLARLRGLVDHLDATAPSMDIPSVLAVRKALGGAARLHLQRLSGEGGEPEEFRRAMGAHAEQLRRVGRPFDAARVDLWLNEAVADPDARDRAETAFAELQAQPYLERIRLPR